ncbi:DVU_1553 family AMP-dependent CoA ligase [Sporobacter termitidis]|uniref:DVU_1553 family AMP-dependent CoA ligase n=1 Tax=Sporobacter termitidis TaxID=44749 RepID=UPI000AE8FC4D|nr:AMP-binding protein [Sporobacter termitidis]
MKLTPLEPWISERAGIPNPPDPARLRQYQLDALRETLRLMKEKSRFYRQRLHDVSPESVVTMEDLPRLPFTSAGDIGLRPEDFLCVPPRDIGRIVTLSTSGTTGRPKRIFFTGADQELTVDFFHHGMTTMADSGDRVMIFMPGSTEGSIGDLLQRGLARFDCASVIYGPVRDSSDALKALIEENITCVVAIPSQMLALAKYDAEGPKALKGRLRSVLLSADYVPRAVSARLEEIWGAPVYGHYGMTETGLGGGVECAARHGYHLREADLLFEIVDPVTGRPVPDGEYGEIVFSTLTRRGMPLLRYRTGDRSRFLTEPCPCGSVLRRLDHVSGRISEAVSLPGGRTLSITQLDEILLAEPSVTAFSAEMTARDGRDCLNITVESAGHFDADMLAQKLEPLLGGLLSEGRLTLSIGAGAVDFFTTGTLKRRIADQRNHEKRSGSL